MERIFVQRKPHYMREKSKEKAEAEIFSSLDLPSYMLVFA